MTSSIDLESGGDALTVVDGEGEPAPKKKPEALEGRSPGQLMWLRFRRDRVGVISACVVIFFFVIAALAPVIAKLYGKDPYTLYAQEPEYPFLLDDFAMPTVGSAASRATSGSVSNRSSAGTCSPSSCTACAPRCTWPSW